jgi:hypothetical protein
VVELLPDDIADIALHHQPMVELLRHQLGSNWAEWDVI